MKYIQIETNRGAGIAHQAHEYFHIFSFCKENKLQLVYCPFTLGRTCWNSVLGFENLYHYKKDDPVFSKIENIDLNYEQNPYELIMNYNDKFPVLFSGDIQKNPKLGQFPKLDLLYSYDFHKNKFRDLYSKNNPFAKTKNIAVHVRRGDVSKEKYPDRFLDLDYFKFVLKNVKKTYPDYDVYLFSQKNIEKDLSIFDEFQPKIKTDISDVETFYYMVNCDILVGSKSGFSHLCHVLGKNKCYCPSETWGLYHKDTVRCNFENQTFATLT
jgi:hypothetical protein